MKSNKAGLAFKELRFSPSTKDSDITNVAIEIWKIENLAVDMYEMLERMQDTLNGNGEHGEFYDDVERLLKRARGE